VGEITVVGCGCTLWSIYLSLKPGRVRGIFEENSFIFFSQVGMLTVDISKKGDVDGILYYFEEGVPPFLTDFIRDFPGRHYWSDQVLLHRLREEKVMPEDLFRGEMKPSRGTVIEV